MTHRSPCSIAAAALIGGAAAACIATVGVPIADANQREPLSREDADARSEALGLSLRRQSRECQAKCVLSVPKAASGLPENYLVRLDIDDRIIRIRCEKDRAAGELVSEK